MTALATAKPEAAKAVLVKLKKTWLAHALDMGLSLYETAYVARLRHEAGQLIFPRLIDLLLSMVSQSGFVGKQSDHWQHNILAVLATLNTFLLLDKTEDDSILVAIQRLSRCLVKYIENINQPHPIELANSDLLFRHELHLLSSLNEKNKCFSLDEMDYLSNNLKHLLDTAEKRIASYNKETFVLTARQSLYSLEGFPDTLLSKQALQALFAKQKSIMTNPAATAKYYTLTRDPEALTYIQKVIDTNAQGGVLPLYPFNNQEIGWLLLYAIRGRFDIDSVFKEEILALQSRLTEKGIGASPYLTEDADDTSVALFILNHSHQVGSTIPTNILEHWWSEQHGAYETFGGAFRSKPDVSTNTHVLMATLYNKDTTQDEKRVVWRRVVHFLKQVAKHSQTGVFWLDKWNISPFYPALDIIDCLSYFNGQVDEKEQTDLHHLAVTWILSNQDLNTGGFISQKSYGPTLEETSYAVLALKCYVNHLCRYAPITHYANIMRAISQGEQFLEKHQTASFVPLWVAKGLYAPSNVIHALRLAAYHLPCDSLFIRQKNIRALQTFPLGKHSFQLYDFDKNKSVATLAELAQSFGYDQRASIYETFGYALAKRFSVWPLTVEQVHIYFSAHVLMTHLDDLLGQAYANDDIKLLMTQIVSLFQEAKDNTKAYVSQTAWGQPFINNAIDILQSTACWADRYRIPCLEAIIDSINAFIWELDLHDNLLPTSDVYLEKILCLKTYNIFISIAKKIGEINLSNTKVMHEWRQFEKLIGLIGAIDNDIIGFEHDVREGALNLIRIYHEQENYALEDAYAKAQSLRQQSLNEAIKIYQQIKTISLSEQDQHELDTYYAWLTHGLAINLDMLNTQVRYHEVKDKDYHE